MFLDDAKLDMMDEEPTANPARIRFARQETDWQRKRREQSSQHRQLMIDQDPWINVAVVEGEVQELVDDQT
jgi:hypothetical protein